MAALCMGWGRSVSAQEDPGLIFLRANRDYEQGDFVQAEAGYRRLAEQYQNVSADVFFNLGNTLYRLQRPGEAMLWYQRALVLQPDFPEVRQNLKFLATQVPYLEYNPTGLESVWLRFSANELVVLASIFLWLAVLLVAAALVVRSWRNWRPVLFLAATPCLLVGGLGAWGFQARSGPLAIENRAVIVQQGVNALTAPLADAKAVIELPEGSEVRVVEDRGPWLRVDIPGDLRGWLQSQNLQRVWPLPMRRESSPVVPAAASVAPPAAPPAS